MMFGNTRQLRALAPQGVALRSQARQEVAASKRHVFDVARARAPNIASPTSLHQHRYRGGYRSPYPWKPSPRSAGVSGISKLQHSAPHQTSAKRCEILGPRLTRLGSGAQEALSLLGAYSGRVRGGGGWHVQKSNLPRGAQGIGVIGSTGRPFEFLNSDDN